jgi:hypothetical protein
MSMLLWRLIAAAGGRSCWPSRQQWLGLTETAHRVVKIRQSER